MTTGVKRLHFTELRNADRLFASDGHRRQGLKPRSASQAGGASHQTRLIMQATWGADRWLRTAGWLRNGLDDPSRAKCPAQPVTSTTDTFCPLIQILDFKRGEES